MKTLLFIRGLKLYIQGFLVISTNILHSARFRNLSKEGLWVVLGQLMAVSGSIVGVRLLTGLMPPAAYGELALGMTAATLVNQAIFGPLNNGVTRLYAPAQEQGCLGSYLEAVLKLVSSATGVVILLLILSVICLLISGLSEWVFIVIAALIFAVLSGYNSILDGIQNAARQRSVVALHQGIGSWLRFCGAGAFLLLLGANSSVAMMGYAISVVIVIVSQCVFVRKITFKNGPGINKKRNWQDSIWNFTWPISIFGVFTWLHLISDRWALELFSTTTEVGLYTVLFQLGYYPMSMGIGMALQFLTPIFYQRAGDATDKKRTENVRTMSLYMTAFTVGGTCLTFLVAMLFHKQIFLLFVNIEYISTSYLLPWMLLSGGFFAAGQTLALNLQSQMKIREIMTAKIVTAIIGVILNFAGAYFFAIKGIVIAGGVFSGMYFLWMLVLSKHKGVENCL